MNVQLTAKQYIYLLKIICFSLLFQKNRKTNFFNEYLPSIQNINQLCDHHVPNNLLEGPRVLIQKNVYLLLIV